ncbi:hypothetical protein JTB14_016539 [Gonioctena quinquepunctata]|nr:hypothetical protein JTB14_016539 [Gonioctena quinquepunctata]
MNHLQKKLTYLQDISKGFLRSLILMLRPTTLSEWYTANMGDTPPPENRLTGHDYLSKKILRNVDDQIHQYIIRIYEYEFCLSRHFFPIEWKTGTIITIPKQGLDHTKTSSYRRITLLPVLGKNLEKIIKNRVQSALGNRIPDYQFGFKNNCSTLLPLTNNIETAKSAQQEQICCHFYGH